MYVFRHLCGLVVFLLSLHYTTLKVTSAQPNYSEALVAAEYAANARLLSQVSSLMFY